jgi:hypothetical protein
MKTLSTAIGFCIGTKRISKIILHVKIIIDNTILIYSCI